MRTSTYRRLSLAIDTFAVIWWTLVGLAILGGLVAALTL